MTYNLFKLEKNITYFKKLIDRYFNCDLLSAHKIGEGFYGVVYLANIKKEPFKVIIKVYKHSGRNELENQQLHLLRQHSLLKIPDVYAVHNSDDEFPFEILLMEYIEGINASMLPTDHPNKDVFIEEMIGNLIHLHSISNVKGFGFDNRMFPDWISCIQSRIGKMNEILHLKFKNSISPYVMEIADKSYDALDKIFSEPIKNSSLIHSDYNLWNILVDEKTAKITAVIDPIDAGWADKEMDLFHLQNADGDRFQLLDYYKQHATITDLFPVKNAFYWFWDDIKHMENMGWYEEERFTSFARKLDLLMKEYIR